MNKSFVFSFVFAFVALVAVMAAIWYWSASQDDNIPLQSATEQPVEEVQAKNIYRNNDIGYSITLTTELSSTTNDALFQVDESHTYTAYESGELIPGVKFIIPRVMTTGTNLSGNSYISVEQLVNEKVCDAVAFIGAPRVESSTVYDGTQMYSFASSSEGAAGSRYEEYVYALSGSSPCTAVRYFIQYSALENYEPGAVQAFNRTKLLKDFDDIRRSLVMN
jgi:hypothetical protein